MSNVIVDASYIFHKSYSIYTKFINRKADLDKHSDRSALARKFLTDLTSTLRGIDYTRRVIICADSSNFRTEIDENYKADRTGRPDGFYITLHKCLDALRSSGFIVSKIDRLEADDLISCWSRYLSSKGEACLIISGDKDTHQLVNALVSVYNDQSKHPKVYCWTWKFTRAKLKDMVLSVANEEDVIEVHPRHVAIEKILIGDSGDNVPSSFPDGGVGPKTVSKIIEKLFKLSAVDDVSDGKNWDCLRDAVESVTSKKFDIERASKNFQIVRLSTDILDPGLKYLAEKEVRENLLRYKYKGSFNAKRILLNSSFNYM